MNTTYTTRNEAIEREIIAAIEGSGEAPNARDEYDIDAIADAVLGGHNEGYALTVEPGEFWSIVADHALDADALAAKANSLTGGFLVRTQGLRAAALYNRAAALYRESGHGHRAGRMEDLAQWAVRNYQP